MVTATILLYGRSALGTLLGCLGVFGVFLGGLEGLFGGFLGGLENLFGGFGGSFWNILGVFERFFRGLLKDLGKGALKVKF